MLVSMNGRGSTGEHLEREIESLRDRETDRDTERQRDREREIPVCLCVFILKCTECVISWDRAGPMEWRRKCRPGRLSLQHGPSAQLCLRHRKVFVKLPETAHRTHNAQGPFCPPSLFYPFFLSSLCFPNICLKVKMGKPCRVHPGSDGEIQSRKRSVPKQKNIPNMRLPSPLQIPDPPFHPPLPLSSPVLLHPFPPSCHNHHTLLIFPVY